MILCQYKNKTWYEPNRYNVHTSKQAEVLFLRLTLCSLYELRGSVQQKLRWLENGVNRCVLSWDCGAGHFYVILLRLYLVFTIFLFLVSTAHFIGKFWKNRWSATSNVAPTVMVLYRIIIGATLFLALKGEAGCLCRANRRSMANSQCQLKVFADFLNLLCFVYWRRMNHGTNSFGAA